MTYEECARCGKHLVEGEVKFILRMTVVGDDGQILSMIEDPDKEIERLISQIEQTDPFELETDVIEERIYILCGRCKRLYMKDPFHNRRDAFFDDDGEDIIGPIQ